MASDKSAADKVHKTHSHMAVRQRVQALERALKESAAIDDLIDFSASISASRARRSCKVTEDDFDDDPEFDIFNDASAYPAPPRPMSAKETAPLAVPLKIDETDAWNLGHIAIGVKPAARNSNEWLGTQGQRRAIIKEPETIDSINKRRMSLGSSSGARFAPFGRPPTSSLQRAESRSSRSSARSTKQHPQPLRTALARNIDSHSEQFDAIEAKKLAYAEKMYKANLRSRGINPLP